MSKIAAAQRVQKEVDDVIRRGNDVSYLLGGEKPRFSDCVVLPELFTVRIEIISNSVWQAKANKSHGHANQ
jgi:hypothetical protein